MDRHIRRLDSDLLKHEESLSLGLRPGTVPSADAREAQSQAIDNASALVQQDLSNTLGGKGHINSVKEPIIIDEHTSSDKAGKQGRSNRKKKGRKDRQQKPANQYVPPEGWQPVPSDVYIDPNEVNLLFHGLCIIAECQMM